MSTTSTATSTPLEAKFHTVCLSLCTPWEILAVIKAYVFFPSPTSTVPKVFPPLQQCSETCKCAMIQSCGSKGEGL